MESAHTMDLRPQAEAPDRTTCDAITRRAGTQLSYNEFYWNYMHANWPVLLTGVSSDWECRRNWTQQSSSNAAGTNENDNQGARSSSINFDYLRNKVGNCRVPVADCSQEYFNSHAKIEMGFHDFLDHWQAKIEKHVPANTINSNTSCESTLKQTHRNLYLKDWHLKALMPDYEFYQVPLHFTSDWLNEQLVSSGQDDYRFVYMGPKDSWTPFHADVFGSYSWSTNIAGCKKWIMLPPGEELKMCDRFGNLPFCIEETKLEAQQVHFFTVLQGENEALFVPSGWYHQVWNLTDTISVNHNWFNACNVERIWCNLCGNMQQVVTEIDDCRQMDNFSEHCQTMLRASFGINYPNFLDMLEFIATRRVLDCRMDISATSLPNKATTSSSSLIFDKYSLNDFHIRHDLNAIRAVLILMLDDEVVCNSRAVLYRRCLKLEEFTRDY